MDVKIDEIVKQVIAEVKTGGKDPAASMGKGACLTEPEHYELRDFDLPVPGPKEILVRVEGCIVSREDADEFLKGIPGYQCPVIGEEGTGTVVRTGGEVKDVHGRLIQEGDRVVALGQVNAKAAGYGDRKKAAQPCGWYTSYILLREDMRILQMNGFDMDSRLLFRQASRAAASVERICKLYKPEKYTRIAVVGCGTEGLLVTAALKCAGFSDIIAVDGDEKRLAEAQKLGAKHKVVFSCRNGMQGMVEKTKACFNGNLADLALQCEELPGGTSIARRFVRSGGSTADLTKHVRTSLTKEAYTAGEKILRLAQTAELPLYRLITHRFHLEEIGQANWTVLSGKGNVCAVLNR